MKACQPGFNPSYHEEAPSLEEIRALPDYAVLEFGNDWCGHCQRAIPPLQDALSPRGLPHIKVADGKGKRLGRAFQVKLWPTVILLHQGEELARVIRPLHVSEIEDLLAHIGQ